VEYIFYFILIFFYLSDYSFFFRNSKIIFRNYQLLIIFIFLFCNFIYIYNLTNLLIHKIDLLLLSILFTISSYFAYLNILAFISRSGTFILLKHIFKENNDSININKVFKLESRLNEIVEKKMAVIKNNYLNLTPKGRFILNIYNFFIRFFNIKVVG